MTYHEHGLNLTKGQADKLQRAAKKGCPVSIRLSHANLQGEHKMRLTFRQVQKITGVTGYVYIGLVEEKQAHLLRKVSKGAIFKNLKLELKIWKKKLKTRVLAYSMASREK